MVLFLDRLERLRHFDIATALKTSGLADKLQGSALDQQDSHGPRQENTELNSDDLSWLDNIGTVQNLRGGKRPEHRDLFRVVESLRYSNESAKHLNRIHTFQPTSFTVVHLNRDPSISSISITEAAARFDLPDLREALEEHFYFRLLENTPQHDSPFARKNVPSRVNREDILNFENIRVWFSLRVQTKSLLQPGRVNKAASISAEPASEVWPLGRHDCALFINDMKESFDGRATLQGTLDTCLFIINLTC